MPTEAHLFKTFSTSLHIFIISWPDSFSLENVFQKREILFLFGLNNDSQRDIFESSEVIAKSFPSYNKGKARMIKKHERVH